MLHSERELSQFDRWDKPRPNTATHGTEEDVSRNMDKLVPTKWTQEGNHLIGHVGDTRVVSILPTDMLLKGTDTSGLPILEKLVL